MEQHDLEDQENYDFPFPFIDYKIIHFVVHGEGENRVCTHTSRDPQSCAFKYGESCILKISERTWFFNDTLIKPFTSSKTTFEKGYEQAIKYYNNIKNN